MKLDSIQSTSATLKQSETISFIQKKTDIKETNIENQTAINNKRKSENIIERYTKADFNKMVASANKFVEVINNKITFSIDDKTSKQIINVYDKETGQLIRKIPPDEMVALVSKLEEIAGILFNHSI